MPFNLVSVHMVDWISYLTAFRRLSCVRYVSSEVLIRVMASSNLFFSTSWTRVGMIWRTEFMTFAYISEQISHNITNSKVFCILNFFLLLLRTFATCWEHFSRRSLFRSLKKLVTNREFWIWASIWLNLRITSTNSWNLFVNCKWRLNSTKSRKPPIFLTGLFFVTR